MARWARRATWVVCCALLALALVSAPAAQDDAEEDDEYEADVEEVDDECIEQSLGWLARRSLLALLAESYPWITQPVDETSLVTCVGEEDAPLQVAFESHLLGPRWERSWTLACERSGTFGWSCEFPEEQTFVHLSEADGPVPIGPEVSPGEALEALAAIVIQSEAPGGIPDPFDATDPFVDLTVDSVLTVTREEICAGLLVSVQLDPDDPENQLCAERACSAQGLCAWSVRVEGTTE